jgi:predicted RNase H-like HicB family nuclease
MLSCSRCGKAHPLKCFLYTSRGNYIAECVDLDLLAQGSTEEEAIGKLQEAMVGYLETAFAGPTEGLVLRPAPISHWVRYFLHRILSRLQWRGRHLLRPTKDVEISSLRHC